MGSAFESRTTGLQWKVGDEFFRNGLLKSGMVG